MEVMHNAAEICREIEEFAYKYLTAEDISIIVDIDEDLISDKSSPYGKAFLTGRLKRKAAFNFAVIRLSDQLSSPAQAIELKIAQAADLGGVQS